MDTVVRVVVIYFVLMFGLRVLGKRQFSQLSPFELVLLILIPEIVSQSLLHEDYSLTNAIIGVTTLFSLVFFTSLLRFRFPALETAIEGEPVVVVRDGELITEVLSRERVPPSDVLSEMHKFGLEHLEQVKWAILETDGTISFIRADGATSVPRKVEKEGAL